MKDKKNIMVFDVESTSLHGKAFAVGAIVIDAITGREVDNLLVKSVMGEKNCSDWVKENVLPHIKFIPTMATDVRMRDRFWEFYLKHKDTCSIWSDVAYPVETNFLEEVYRDDPERREFAMPYPLFDISSHLDESIDRVEFSELRLMDKHNPLHDAMASAYSLMRVRANLLNDLGQKGNFWAAIKTSSEQSFN